MGALHTSRPKRLWFSHADPSPQVTLEGVFSFFGMRSLTHKFSPPAPEPQFENNSCGAGGAFGDLLQEKGGRKEGVSPKLLGGSKRGSQGLGGSKRRSLLPSLWGLQQRKDLKPLGRSKGRGLHPKPLGVSKEEGSSPSLWVVQRGRDPSKLFGGSPPSLWVVQRKWESFHDLGGLLQAFGWCKRGGISTFWGFSLNPLGGLEEESPPSCFFLLQAPLG